MLGEENFPPRLVLWLYSDVAASEARGLGVSNNTRTASAIYVEVGSCARVRAYGLFIRKALSCIHYVVLLQLGLKT